MRHFSKFGFFRAPHHYAMVLFVLKWLLIGSVLGLLSGSASAVFLLALNWVTEYREQHLWIIGLLPLGGLAIGMMYHYLGKGVEAGNNLLIDAIHSPGKTIPFKMAPLVLLGTLFTHLFGGSAGREGTAVQMGGAIADQFTHWFRLKTEERRLLITAGISAGFASVFGTPLAGIVFGLEVFLMGRMRYEAIFPATIAAVVADYTTTHLWQVGHTHYTIGTVPDLSALHIVYSIGAGITFGGASLLFSKATHLCGAWFKRQVSYPPLRPLLGGGILVLAFYLVFYFLQTTKYTGLGIATIVEAFQHPLPSYDFALKLLFTAFTLGCGFKGGEVTPLFFIGAALGSTLSCLIPLPTGLLAGMGFVAVFAGAANTPLACTLMAMELFGNQCGIYAGIACVTAYLFSGHTGIYTSQIVGSSKHAVLQHEEGQTLSNIEAKGS